MRRPVVELSECVLCEICTDLCPLVFRLNQAGYVEVVELDEYPDEDVENFTRSSWNHLEGRGTSWLVEKDVRKD